MSGYKATRSVLRQVDVLPPELDRIVAEYAVIHEWSIPTPQGYFDRSATSMIQVADGPHRWIVRASSNESGGTLQWLAGVCLGSLFCRFTVPPINRFDRIYRTAVVFDVDVRRKTVAASSYYSDATYDDVSLVTANSDFAPDDFGLFYPYVEFANHLSVTIESIL